MKLGNLIFAARLTAAVIILWFIDFNKLILTLRSVNAGFIVLAVLLEFAGFLVWTLKWKLLVDRLEKIKFTTLFLGLMAGNCLSTDVLRARTIGGFGLAMFLKNISRDRMHANWYATVAIDQAGNNAVFSLLVIFSLLFVFMFLNIPLWLSVLMQAIVAILFILALTAYFAGRKIEKAAVARFFYSNLGLVYNFSLFRFIRNRFGSYKKFEEFAVSSIEEFVKTCRSLMNDRGSFAGNLVLTTIMFAFIYSKAYMLYLSVGYDIPILHLIVSLTLILWISAILPGGFGFKEVLMISIYAMVGVPIDAAVIVSLIDRAIYLFFVIVISYLAIAYIRIFHTSLTRSVKVKLK